MGSKMANEQGWRRRDTDTLLGLFLGLFFIVGICLAAFYSDALGRHLAAEGSEGPTDHATGLLHAAQVAWNALARIELTLRDH